MKLDFNWGLTTHHILLNTLKNKQGNRQAILERPFPKFTIQILFCPFSVVYSRFTLVLSIVTQQLKLKQNVKVRKKSYRLFRNNIESK